VGAASGIGAAGPTDPEGAFAPGRDDLPAGGETSVQTEICSTKMLRAGIVQTEGARVEKEEEMGAVLVEFHAHTVPLPRRGKPDPRRFNRSGWEALSLTTIREYVDQLALAAATT
jgi:hypothetical protein